MKTSSRTTACRGWLANCFSGTNIRGRGFLLSALLCFIPIPALSDLPIILVLQSGKSPVYQIVSSTILSDLDSICAECKTYQFKQADIDDTSIDELLRSDDSRLKLIVTIGVKAAQLIASSKTSIPTLHTLIPNSSAALLKLDGASQSVSVIYLDQPLTRQLNLIKLIRRDNQVLGVLLGPATNVLRPILDMAAKNMGIPIRMESVTEEGEIGPTLRHVLDDSDILLALPDPLIYNRNTIFNIILSSYHNQVPVIGFSASYAKAGAMLAVHSTPSEIGMHIAEAISQFIITGGGHLPDSAFPKYFSIEVNKSVAHSLDINLPGAEELKQRLERLEGQ